jgi:murein DD-endopeptidase MepM/ murein hydrolase activator NlpD
MHNLYFAFFFIISISKLIAQNYKNDFLKITTPQLNYVEDEADYDSTLQEITNDQFGNSGFIDEKKNPLPKDYLPLKELSIVSEDTSSIYEGEQSIVEMEEQIKMDCVWVKVAEHYTIWDSRNINPYGIDGLKVDSVLLLLYDTTISRFWCRPLKNCKLNSDFGFRRFRWHYGVDLDLQVGDSVFTIFDGVVRIKGWDRYGYGNFVLIRHFNGLETIYGHLSKVTVRVGDLVKAGDLIGFGGSTGRSTGPHLHLEFRYAGNPIDPKYLFDFNACALKGRVVWISQANFQYMKEARKIHFHVVRNGDTLSKISRKYGVPLIRLCKLNGITTKTKLRVGQKIRIS